MDFSTFIADPFNQLLLSIPLSVVGNLTTDSAKFLYNELRSQDRVSELEETLFDSFEKALQIHQGRYDSVARKQSKELEKLVKRRRSDFLKFLRSMEDVQDYALVVKLDDAQIRDWFTSAFIQAFSDEIPSERHDFVSAIMEDTCRIYRNAFFESISQEQQLWIVFREAFKIDSVIDLVKDIQSQMPTRAEFEALRKLIISTEPTPNEISLLKIQYLNYLERRFSSLELTGVSPRIFGQDIAFDLEQIFIPLHVNASNYSATSIFQTQTEELASLFNDNDQLVREKVRLLQHVEAHPKIVLLGNPGSGKTTLLKYLTLLLSRFQRASNFLPFYVPIFLKVSEYAHVLQKNPSKRLLDFLLNDYDRQFGKLFQWALENGQVVLALDGLDEVLDISQRLKVVNEVHDIVARMPENRYIISSRIVGYEDARLGAKFVHFTIQPFNHSQIKNFCEVWYKAVLSASENNLEQLKTRSEKLFTAIISKKEIANLASNPLLITLIASIHFKGHSLPSNRVQLYDVATETLLQYWVQQRVTDGSQLKEKDDVIEILSPIAFHIHDSSPEGLIEEKDFYAQCSMIFRREEYALTSTEIKREVRELIRFLREQSGFFHEKGIDDSSRSRYFGFLHQTFQEYLAAIEIINRWKENSLDFANLIGNARWVESLRLAAGILKGEKGRSGKRNVSNFVSDIVLHGESNDEHYHLCLFLVVLILSDEIDLLPKRHESFVDRYIKSWTESSGDDVRKEYLKHASLLVRSKHGNHFWEQIRQVLENHSHKLRKHLPMFLVDNVFYIQAAKQQFIKLLLSSDKGVRVSAWESLRDHMVAVDQSFYYAVSHYGDMYYAWQEEDPSPSVNNLVSYSEFLAQIEALDPKHLDELMGVITKTMDSYIYLFYSNGWGNAPEDYVKQMVSQESLQTVAVFLAILVKQRDMQKQKDEIVEFLRACKPNNEDELFLKYSAAMIEHLNSLTQSTVKDAA